MEFFMQTLVKRGYKSQGWLITMQHLLMTISTVAALEVGMCWWCASYSRSEYRMGSMPIEMLATGRWFDCVFVLYAQSNSNHSVNVKVKAEGAPNVNANASVVGFVAAR